MGGILSALPAPCPHSPAGRDRYVNRACLLQVDHRRRPHIRAAFLTVVIEYLNAANLKNVAVIQGYNLSLDFFTIDTSAIGAAFIANGE